MELPEIKPNAMTLDAQFPPHVMGQHTGKITGMGIVARSARQGFSGPGIDRVRSHRMRMLHICDIFVATIAEFVDLHGQKSLEFGSVGIVTFRTALGDRIVQLLPPEDTAPVVAGETYSLPFFQEEVFAVTEVRIVAARTRALFCQCFVQVGPFQFFLRILVAVETE
jgi:hypothetical protein